MTRIRYALFCLLALFCIVGDLPCAEAFVGDLINLRPHAGYQTIQTPHFKLVFPKEYSVEAEASARYLEDAHTVLSRAFQYSPGHRCTVILTDNFDLANGLTSAVGLQGLVIYLTSPDPYSSIGEYENWLRNLIVHEYAHYVTLEQTRGFFQFTRYLLGHLIFPNHLWPSWISEGMAVFAESAFTRQGRGRGTYYTTLARDAIYRDRLGRPEFLDFGRLNGTVPDFPFGESHYFAGYGIIDELLHRHGVDAASRYAEESSWRVPFFLNGALENIVRDPNGDSFQSLWSGYIEREKKRMAPDLDWLKKNGAPDPQFLTPEGISANGARLSPDETRVAYTIQSGHERPALYVRELSKPEPKRIEDAIASPGLAWSHDGAKLYYSKFDYRNRFDLFGDLFEYDVSKDSVKRLTHEARAKDPEYCQMAQGPALIYTTQRGRVSELRKLDLASKRITTLYRAADHHHVSNPRCSLDGKQVYFAEHTTRPRDAIHVLSLGQAQAKPRHVAGGPDTDYSALFPEPAADGDLYFTRAKGGFYELARLDAKSARITTVARSSGGYWLPSLGRKSGASKMAVSYLSSTGIRAGLINAEQLEQKLSGVTLKKPEPDPILGYEEPKPSPAPVIESRGGYNLLTSLQPRLWSPYLLLSDTQNQYGGLLMGWDDTDQLEYTLWGWYDTASKRPGGIASTFHRIDRFKLGLSASSQVDSVVSIGTRKLFDEERKFSAKLSRPFPGVFSNFTPSFVAEWARTTRDGDFGRRIFSPDQRLGLDLDYSTLRRYAYSVAQEKGTGVELMGRRYFSGSLRAWKGLANLEQVVPVFPAHSSLALNGYFGVAPNPVFGIPESSLKVGGQGTLSDLDPPLRGYPTGNFETKRVGILQAEYRTPLAQIFRGWGTFPVFFQNLGLFAFYDGAKLENRSGRFTNIISGAGGGMLFNTQLAYFVPVAFRVEFAHGFNRGFGGQDSISLNFSY